MEPPTELTPEQKLLASLDLFAWGCAMQRENLRRAHPDADEATLDELLQRWLRTRPGAEHGDGVGRPGVWPRRRREAPDA